MFLGDNFLLDTPLAVELYHNFAVEPPILDYHCHLSPEEIAQNRQFESITDLWLGGDHYKWRAMRANGVAEDLVTGNSGAWEKFQAWARTVPAAAGNPLYQWTHLELRRYFGIEDILDPRTARSIFDRCNEALATDEFRVRSLMSRMRVRAVCTTDDPSDDLACHREINSDQTFDIPVYPTFRPDKAFKVEDAEAWNGWIDSLGKAADVEIDSFDDLVSALGRRVAYFHTHGCRVSDHGIRAPFPIGSLENARRAFVRARAGGVVPPEDAQGFAGAVMLELGRMYAEREWVMQIHLGSVRNNSSRMLERLGPDTGFDAIGDQDIADGLVGLLDALDQEERVPKTILYTLNPRDNELLASIAGSFQDGSVPGKMQLGSGWWFNDQRDGMERQMTALANIGILSRFVGMTTDSRSFLSYPRHEYFRRVLARLIGRWVTDGELPDDPELLGPMIGDICYGNAERYFALPGVSRREV